jgi:hypothetical protein
MHRHLASLYNSIINNFPCSQEGIIIMVKYMTSKEQRIEQIQSRITESKRALGVSRQAGPLMLTGAGIMLFLALVMGSGVGFFGIGVITVSLAIIWAYSKSRDPTQLKKEIYHYEWDLYNLEKDLDKGNLTGP